MIRIVADDKIPFLHGALEKAAQIRYIPGAQISRNDLMEADALITRTRTRCNRELLEGTSVRFIATATIGYDHIDTDYCAANGITWTNAPGCNSSSVRQYLVSTLLYLTRLRKLQPGNMTLGVVGVGNVGSKVALAAEALGMRVLLNDPPRQRREKDPKFLELDRLLAESDVLTLHVPLNRGGGDNTYELVNEEFTRKMKKGAVLINTSRGAVIREEAVLKAIRSGILADVILDVFPEEPKINPDLLGAITLATPHIAGYSMDGKANGTSMSVQAVSRFFSLGLDDWLPESVPLPSQPELLADASRGSLYEVLWEIFRETYDVTADNRNLRNDPAAFEKLRGNYPLRREQSVYSVRLFQGYEEISDILEKLGFTVLCDKYISKPVIKSGSKNENKS
ncbi:MAG: 4-phosphoerythronate dehydrogenase PdxB [Bacteroidota bacterium]